MAFNRNLPYNGLPLLPPRQELETKIVLKKLITANRKLAELKGSGDLIPNQGMLINSIVLQEARSSSEIENIVTTQDDLFQAAAADDGSIETKEVLRYRQALWEGFQTLGKRPLSTATAVAVVRSVKQVELDIRQQPGTKIANLAGEIIYTPPEGEGLIRDLMANLELFIHAEDGIDPLIKLAVMHYQFEAIHPFIDGNGRTGRILNILYLVEKGLLDIPVLYLSKYIIESKNAYYEGLQKVTEQGAWEEWILYMLDALEKTAQETREKVIKIRALLEATTEWVRAGAPKIYSKDLIEMLFKNPYCKIQFLVDANIAKRQTASLYLQELEKLKVLGSQKIGREIYYINTSLMKILA